VSYAHIQLDENGFPIIAGTRMKVRMIALDQMAYGWDAPEIQRAHPHLTLGQIHSALSYYHDHKAEMDRNITERYERAQKSRVDQEDSPGRCKLRKRGLLP
jgi:uncharacterized protein (DUF433 family)